jgi:RNA polymerase sigma factor (sigma-70 family)
MADDPDTLLRYLHRLGVRPDLHEVSDAALLGSFLAARDERAFAALVERHGPLVLQVCRRVLGDGDDAEDAFQATFLVLARNAGTVRRAEALAAWLHGVARRVALKARSAKARQSHGMRDLIAFYKRLPVVDPLAEFSGRELVTIIDEELQRLPEVYRLPVLLCCVEGRSLEEAAQQLGWTLGSVKGRLERGRARLHDRLLRRGLTLSTALAAAEVSGGAAPAAVVARLAAVTAQGALAFGAGQMAEAQGISAGAAALAGKVIEGMGVPHLKASLSLVLALCLLATGYLTYRAATSPPTSASKAEESLPLPAVGKDALAVPAGAIKAQLGDPWAWADVPVSVSGRVLDPEGRPIVGAKLYVGFSARRPGPQVPFRPLAYRPRATSETDGRFHFAFTLSQLDAASLEHSQPAVIAVAPGYGPAWADIKESAARLEVSLKLTEDIPIDGRILSRDQKPVGGARILVWEIAGGSEAALTQVLLGQACFSTGKGWSGPLPEHLPFVTTTADGRFRLTGIGRDRIVTLVMEGPGVQRTFVWAATRPRPAARSAAHPPLASFDYIAPVSYRIRGIVRDKATGQPVAGVKLSARGNIYRGGFYTSLSDNTGGYEILVPPQPPNPAFPALVPGWALWAQPEQGQLYFATSSTVLDEASPDPIVEDIELIKGIPVHGRVTEQTTGKPPKAAVVEYYPVFPNPHSSKITNGPEAAASSCLVQPDGSYRLVVLPGPGVVCAAASPRDWYAAAIVDEKELATLAKDGIERESGTIIRAAVGADAQGVVRVSQYNVVSLINPGEGATSMALDLLLQRSRPIKGTVFGPDGKPLAGATVAGLTAFPEEVSLESASFAVWGLNPCGARTVFFHHRTQGLGKTVIVPGDQTEPLTVQLEPCGSLVGRLVDMGAKPISGQSLHLSGKDGCLFTGAVTDHQGRFLAALVPGRKYWLTLLPPRRLLRDDQPVELRSVEVKDLGDLSVGD